MAENSLSCISGKCGVQKNVIVDSALFFKLRPQLMPRREERFYKVPFTVNVRFPQLMVPIPVKKPAFIAVKSRHKSLLHLSSKIPRAILLDLRESVNLPLRSVVEFGLGDLISVVRSSRPLELNDHLRGGRPQHTAYRSTVRLA